MARSASYLERGAEILSIGSCAASGIDEERRAVGTYSILLIGGKAK